MKTRKTQFDYLRDIEQIIKLTPEIHSGLEVDENKKTPAELAERTRRR